jgi:hypothetical protein
VGLPIFDPGGLGWDEDDGKMAAVDQMGSRVVPSSHVVTQSDHDGVGMLVPGDLRQ